MSWLRVWRQSCLPGQFIIVKMDEEGERIPLTICDYDREKQERLRSYSRLSEYSTDAYGRI